MATPYSKAVERLRVIVESTFATDATGSLGSFTDVPANEGSMTVTLNKAEMDPNYLLQRRMDARPRVLGPKRPQLKFTITLAPTGTAAGASTAAVSGCLGLLLKAVMGGEDLGTGTTFSAGWTAITGTVASASGLTAGAYIGWRNSSGVVEWRQIKSKSSNTLVLAHGFSGTPANSDVCYAAATYYVTEDPSQSLQFIAYGQSTADRWLLLGCQCVGFDLSVDPSGKGIPSITFTFEAANWLEGGSTAGSITGTIADATYTNYSPIVEYAGDYEMFTVGTPTYVATTCQVPISALSWKPKFTFTALTSPSATATATGGSPIFRWRATRTNPPLEGSFTTFMDAMTWWNKRDAKASMAQQYTIGISGGSAIVLAAPTVQVLNPQRGASDQEIEGQVVSIVGRCNTDTALSTDLAKSPFVIVLG